MHLIYLLQNDKRKSFQLVHVFFFLRLTFLHREFLTNVFKYLVKFTILELFITPSTKSTLSSYCVYTTKHELRIPTTYRIPFIIYVFFSTQPRLFFNYIFREWYLVGLQSVLIKPRVNNTYLDVVCQVSNK